MTDNASVTNVYLVWYDNMEPYEDGYTCVQAAFSTRKKAEEYIKGKGYAYGKPAEPFGWAGPCWHKVEYFDGEPWNITKFYVQKMEVD